MSNPTFQIFNRNSADPEMPARQAVLPNNQSSSLTTKEQAKKLKRDALLAQLSSEEKIKLLSGDDMWHTAPIERLGIPRVRCSDGPNGVRGTAWTNGAPASCFPCATGLGASFDVQLVKAVGVALGAECRARGVHCLLGPTTNIQRHPCGGRGFESFSEDPFLSGTLAANWIQGVQSQKVMATPKQFMRRSNNSIIDERTMHEIYLEPFRLQMKANPKVFMTSYNRVNGLHVAEHPDLLRGILRGDWGFKGLIMSDWSGTYSSSEAIKAGLDLEMPGPAIMRGACIERDIVSGKLESTNVDDCVGRVLDYINEAEESGIDFEATEKTEDTPAIRSLLLKAAESGIVLLNNAENVLPVNLREGKKVAVIGPNAKIATISGGGSANLAASYSITPFQAIENAAKQVGATVSYTKGADGERWLPLLTPYITLPGGTVGKEPGVVCHFYDQNPFLGKHLEPIFSKFNNSGFSYFIDGIPASVPVRGYVSLKSQFIPDESGLWELGLGVSGQADLYIDGRKLIDNSTHQTPSVLFFNMGAEERVAEIEVTAGTAYDLEVRFSNFKQLHSTSPYSGRRGGIRIGGRLKRDPETEIEKAVNLARSSDVVILCIGTNSEWESEAYDRDNLKLPGRTDDLIRAVLAVHPRAIIVNQSGMPVEFPWLSEASTLLQAFFGGNECGTAIANAIFGRKNPSGKLPITWPIQVEDFPSHQNFGNPIDTVYSEGLEVGYRYFDRPGNPSSAFPFGFGLSYSSFAFDSMTVEATDDGARVTFAVKNIGSVAGATVGQVYVKQLQPKVFRPEIELGGFEKVFLGPGESRTVSIVLDHKAFSFYSESDHCWLGEAGDYVVYLGSSSTDLVESQTFHLNQSFRWIGQQEPTRQAP